MHRRGACILHKAAQGHVELAAHWCVHSGGSVGKKLLSSGWGDRSSGSSSSSSSQRDLSISRGGGYDDLPSFLLRSLLYMYIHTLRFSSWRTKEGARCEEEGRACTARTRHCLAGVDSARDPPPLWRSRARALWQLPASARAASLSPTPTSILAAEPAAYQPPLERLHPST